ncbi:hypothetical protein [Pseudocolwellia sp. HL-MZ7]|uniref:hypothetical protein n=1 Tax=Pseudocolwellia sp. HL-MZ7 TaxID=3400627 RepID=UPI003CEE7928
MSNNIKHNYPIILVSLTFLALAIWASILSWSEILTIRPQKVLKQLNKTHHIEPTLINKMIDRVNTSTTLNPSSANNHLILAQLYEYLHESSPEKNNINYLVLAESEYLKAIYLQPNWDKAWAQLAKFYDKKNDGYKMLYALEKAMFLGPFEYNIQELILPVIFKYWELVNNSDKNADKIKQILKHIFKYKKKIHLTFTYALKSKNLEAMKVIEFMTSKKEYKKQLKIQRLKLQVNDSQYENTNLDVNQ